MPLTGEAKRVYQREWLARRRAEWFSGKTCHDCGTTEALELDHVDPKSKVHHAIWSWAAHRRLPELAKCVARCKPCHAAKSAKECAVGEANGRAVLATETVSAIRARYAAGERQVDIARSLDIDRRYVWEIVRRKTRIYED